VASVATSSSKHSQPDTRSPLPSATRSTLHRNVPAAAVDLARPEGTECRRIIAISGAGCRPPPHRPGPIRRSASPKRNSGLTARYRTALERNVRRGIRLSRADAAHLMLQALTEPSTFGHAIAAAY
jgi:hypothetical protein